MNQQATDPPTIRLEDLPSPSLVVDGAALRRNLDEKRAAAARAGLTWRIETQPAKSIDVARLAFAAAGVATAGIAVSTLAEAEYFLAHEVVDILYAVPVTPGKLDQIAKLTAAGASMLLTAKDAQAAAAIAAHPAGCRTLLTVDADADPTALPDMAAALGPHYAGIFVEAGAAHRAGAAFGCLAAAGHPPAVVSLRKEAAAADLPGATELRAGARMFDALALTLLASVTARRAGPGGSMRLWLDAGGVALCSATGEVAGTLLDIDAAARFGHAAVRCIGPEQSMIEIETTASLPRPGDRLRVALRDPALTASGHDRMFVLDGGHAVVAAWSRVGGW